MASTKKRPRKHVIASISVHATALIISREGHAVDVPNLDYGTDLTVSTFDPVTRELEPEYFGIQMKATESLKVSGSNVKFDVEITDLRAWSRNLLPFFLIVYDIRNDVGYWLDIQAYLKAEGIDPDKLVGNKRRVSVPMAQVVDTSAVAYWRDLKNTRARELRQ